MSGPLGFGDDDPRDERPNFGPTEKPDKVAVPRPPGASRYTWFIGVVGVLLIAIVSLNSIRTPGRAPGVAEGAVLPPFAVPLAARAPTKFDDANLATERGQGEAGRIPACEVRGPQILNSCELAERGPVVLLFVATRSARCLRQLELFDDVRRRLPGVQFAAISVKGDRKKAAAFGRNLGIPVGYDKDGAVANLYGNVVCPQTVFADRGGDVINTEYGELTAQELLAQAKLLK